jgi:hypothetical protein
MQVLMPTVGWGCETLNKIVMNQGILANNRNIQIHNSAFIIFPVLQADGRTDGQKCIRETKDPFLWLLSRTP